MRVYGLTIDENKTVGFYNSMQESGICQRLTEHDWILIRKFHTHLKFCITLTTETVITMLAGEE